MDIDKLFKLPPAPAGSGSKRKFPDLPTEEVLKRFRQEGYSTDFDKTPSRAASVEDEVSGVLVPQDNEEDDEEGRFFGGGLSEEQTQIMDIFDRAGDDDLEDGPFNVPALRRLIGRFERTVTRNAEQRGKYPNDPTRFLESESNLDSVIKEFLLITQNPALYYPELVSQGVVGLFSNLLSHDNTDIAVDVIEVLRELTDDDIGADESVGGSAREEGSTDGDVASAARLALAQLVDELLANSIFELLVSNLGRLNEEEDADRQGVFQILGVFENLLSFMPPLADQVGTSTSLLDWLLKRISQGGFDSNKQYAAELLSILLQSSRQSVDKVAESGGFDTLLLALSKYRKQDPQDGEESEFMENTFDCICSLLRIDENKMAFVNAEGIELMIIMVQEKRQARSCAIKVLDYAVQNEAGTPGAERFVEMLGLKTLFSAFMGRGDKKRKNIAPLTFEDDEHIVSIIASLFSNLASDTAPRLRLMAKFIESDYEKADRLLELRETASRRLAAVDQQIREEKNIFGATADDAQEEDWYIRRLDAGLSALQLCDYVVCWVCVEDDGAKAHVERLLSRRGDSLSEVIKVLRDMITRMDESGVEDTDPALIQKKYILQGLVNSLS